MIWKTIFKTITYLYSLNIRTTYYSFILLLIQNKNFIGGFVIYCFFAAAIAMMIGFLATLISLSIVHNQVPLNDPPLPDIILDNVPEIDPALNVSEYIIVFNVLSCIVCILLHKHRWVIHNLKQNSNNSSNKLSPFRFIIMRRIFLLMSLLYMYRAITMFVTVLPLANRTYPCAPESNHTSVVQVIKRVIKMSAGFGLSINGDQIYCGDFIYSGHTVILVLSYLVISECEYIFYANVWLKWRSHFLIYGYRYQYVLVLQKVATGCRSSNMLLTINVPYVFQKSTSFCNILEKFVWNNNFMVLLSCDTYHHISYRYSKEIVASGNRLLGT